MAVSVPPIPNADQGVALALSYELGEYCSYEDTRTGNTGCVPLQNVSRLLVISGGSVASDNNVNVGQTGGLVTPILQAEDGTYFGTEGGTSDCANSCMGAFDLAGNVKWSVPGYTPVMATADGGLIAKQLSTGQYETFDQNGVANGQLASPPTFGWVGTAYQNQFVVNQVSVIPADYAESYDAVVGGSQSSNGAFIKESPYPLMKSCYNPSNNTLCAYDSLLEAL